MEYQDKITELEGQAEQAKTLWIKCQGAIEVLQSLQADKKPEKDLASKKDK